MDYEELSKRIDENADKIISNFRKIQKNSTKIDGNAEKIEKNSYALDILKDYKRESRRLYSIIIIVLAMWVITVGYLVYVLNDIGTIDETVTQKSDNGNNNYIGNDGDINNDNTNY